MQSEQTAAEKSVSSNEEKNGRKLTKRTITASFLILVLVPLTIFLSWKYGERRFYLTSLLIIVYSMMPFFLVFEKRKPKARELVVLAVLCAIAAGGRAAFVMLNHFKPLVAVVIITGISFGPEAGFMCGAVSGFVSNFIAGQGPWTPWQMFSFGIAGFLAGVFYQKGLLKKENRIGLCIFGGLCTQLVVGVLLDLCALFTMGSVISWEMYLTLLISGLPVNAVHAAATVFFLFIISKPMFEKIDRIKIKYGMLE